MTGTARARLLMPVLILAELVSGFEATMIYAALKQFYSLYHDPVAIGWVIAGFMLVASIAAVICGRLGDMYGRRTVLVFVLMVACAGSVLSAATTHLGWIVFGRSIQGLAGAILPLCYGLVREHSAPSRMKINIGMITATASGGAALGAVLGGMLVDHGGWRMIFVLSAILAATATVLVRAVVPADPPRFSSARIDWPGAALFIVGMGLLMYALGAGEKEGWGGASQLWIALCGAVLLTGWVVHELRTEDPMIDVRMLGRRQIGVTLAVFSLGALGAFNYPQVLLLLIQQPTATHIGLGLTATQSGTYYGIASVLGIAASPIIGWITARHGGRTGMIVTMATLAIAWLGLLAAHGSLPAVAFWMALNGLGMGAMMACAPILIVEVAPGDRVSEATGLAQAVRKIAMACGAQIVAVSLARSTVAAGGGVYPDSTAYLGTFLFIAGCNIAGLVLCLLLPGRAGAVSRPISPRRLSTDIRVSKRLN